MSKLRLCFAGTPEFAAAHLQALLQSPHEILAVYTQPDRPAGRGKKLSPSPVKQIALEAGLELRQPASLRDPEQEQLLRDLEPDLLIVVAYGLILPASILSIPRLGCINVHASLLPRWRGAAPIERALLAGDSESGVTIMQMDEGLDTGDMLLKETVTIDHNDDRDSLELKIQQAGKHSLISALEQIEKLLGEAQKQDESQSTYAAKLEKSEAQIDWRQEASLIDRQIRAGIGRFPAFTFLDGQRLRILKASIVNEESGEQAGSIINSIANGENSYFIVACGKRALRIEEVQLPGKAALKVGQVLNSRPDLFRPGKLFANPGHVS